MLRSSFIFLASPPMDDLVAAFRVLGLQFRPNETGSSPAVTSEQVRSQYLQLARLHHPDLSSGDDAKMKVINTAYELIQSSGVVAKSASTNSQSNASPADGSATRFTRKAGSLRRKVPDTFANGDLDGASSWSMKSTLEWRTMMDTFSTVTKEELSNPANHIFSHSKFFSFDDDITIYKMIRSGATVPQVGRTLGKPATFIERRIHNAQFKARVQYILRNENKKQKAMQSRATNGPSPSVSNNKKSKWKTASMDNLGRLKEWEPTLPHTRPNHYFSNMSLEEKGRFSKILPDDDEIIPSGSPRSRNVPSYTYKNYSRFSGGTKA